MQVDPEISQGRRPKNAAEAEFFDAAANAGWSLTKRGWPDFFLKRGEDVVVVEVKPVSSRALRREQARVLAALCEARIPCGIWSPDGGLQRVSVGVRGLQFVVVEGQIGKALDVIEGESEGKQPQLVPIEGDESTPPSPAPAGGAAEPTAAEMAASIDNVWTAYVELMKPRFKELTDEDRLIIRNGLRVATERDLVICIRECEKSDYHMKRGEHVRRKGGKYNALGKILKPRPRLGETQRSRIEWWLERADDSSAVAGFPSADPAIVGQRQVEVQRGHRSRDPETVKKAETAEEWLAKHGIETVRRREDGYPIFRRVGSEE